MLNELLGSVGTTVYYTEPVELNLASHKESLHLCASMAKGKVDLLLILGGNPVYDAPHDWDFVSKMKKVHTIVHLSTHYNETSEYSQWHIPEAHFLEMWGDARAFDGTYSVIQPLIAPLYRANSAFEVLSAFSDKPGITALDTIRERLKGLPGGADGEKLWRKSLNDGFVAGSAFAPISVSAKATLASLAPAKPTAEMEYLFRQIRRSMTAALPTTAAAGAGETHFQDYLGQRSFGQSRDGRKTRRDPQDHVPRRRTRPSALCSDRYRSFQ